MTDLFTLILFIIIIQIRSTRTQALMLTSPSRGGGEGVERGGVGGSDSGSGWGPTGSLPRPAATSMGLSRRTISRFNWIGVEAASPQAEQRWRKKYIWRIVSSHRHYMFQADDEESRREWLTALTSRARTAGESPVRTSFLFFCFDFVFNLITFFIRSRRDSLLMCDCASLSRKAALPHRCRGARCAPLQRSRRSKQCSGSTPPPRACHPLVCLLGKPWVKEISEKLRFAHQHLTLPHAMTVTSR